MFRLLDDDRAGFCVHRYIRDAVLLAVDVYLVNEQVAGYHALLGCTINCAFMIATTAILATCISGNPQLVAVYFASCQLLPLLLLLLLLLLLQLLP